MLRYTHVDTYRFMPYVMLSGVGQSGLTQAFFPTKKLFVSTVGLVKRSSNSYVHGFRFLA